MQMKFQYDPETGVIMRGKEEAGRICETWPGCFYRQIQIGKCTVYAHELAWCIYYGRWPTWQVIPLNGNHLDCRIENLRMKESNK